MILNKLDLDKVLKCALQHGGEFAEIFYEHTDARQIIFEDSKVDRLASGIDSGVGIRIIYGEQSVYGHTTEPSENGLLELAATLSKVVQGKLTKADISFNPTKSAFDYQITKDPSKVSLKDKIAFVQKADRIAWEHKDVKQVSVGYIETRRKIEVVNSLGNLATDDKQYLTMFAKVVGQREDQVQTSFEAQGGYYGLELIDKYPPEKLAKEAVRRLDVLLSAKPAPAGTMPVIMAAEAGGTMIHEAVGHGLEADLACNHLSVYGPKPEDAFDSKIGTRVANELVTVIDDGTMPEKRGSYAVDDEGTASKENVLIKDGILKSYMVDRLSQTKFNMPLTGNGRRESFRFHPICRMTNTYLVPGKDDPNEILKSTDKGLFVKSMGGGQVDTVTGNFVFAVTEGYLIHNGEIGPAVRGATLTGNGPDVLNKVDRVGNDLGFEIGTCGKDGQGAPVTDAQPTIRTPELTVGGEVPMDKYWN